MISLIVAVFKLLLSGILGAIFGYEEKRTGRTAGLRLPAILCVGATGLTIAALKLGTITDSGDPGIAVLGIIISIGVFAGLFLNRDDPNKANLLSAAGLWSAGIVGILVGTGQIIIAILTAGLLYYILRYLPSVINKEIEPGDEDLLHDE